jgi:hypothetical protein
METQSAFSRFGGIWRDKGFERLGVVYGINFFIQDLVGFGRIYPDRFFDECGKF